MGKKRKPEYSLPFREEQGKGNKEGERTGSKKRFSTIMNRRHGLKGGGFNRQNGDQKRKSHWVWK